MPSRPSARVPSTYDVVGGAKGGSGAHSEATDNKPEPRRWQRHCGADRWPHLGA